MAIRSDSLRQKLEFADMQICEALDEARKLASGSYQDCFETTEVEALRFTADLAELRLNLVALQNRLAR